jgi:TPR repeat protein/virulence-associated protein VagC
LLDKLASRSSSDSQNLLPGGLQKTFCLRVDVTTLDPVAIRSNTMSTTTDDTKQFSVGTQWMIKNLTSETGKKFNGKTCVIVSTFDVTSGRVGVQIKNARNKGRTLNIKPINLHADQTTTLMEGVKETTPQEAEDEEDCPQEEEDKEDCPICTDALPKLSDQFTRYTCCGKGLHNHCHKDLMSNTSMTYEQKMTCLMCRAKVVKIGSEKNIERLRNWAKKGKAWAMNMLAQKYIDGVGVKQSDKKAIELYEMAAKRGQAAAQYNLGIFYDQGIRGLTESSTRAFEYYTLAANQGHAEAQYNLGLTYYIGKGVETCYAKAREWWTKAAAQGNEDAIHNLKVLDEKEGVKSTTTPTPEVVDENIISCSTCGKQQTKEFRLGKCACRTKRYCDSQCQKKQYKKHKKECLRLVKERKKKRNGKNMKENGTKDGKKEHPIHEEEDKEDCPICTDALPKLSGQFTRLTCCGKGLHNKCFKDLQENTSMTLEQKYTCIMCRAKAVAGGSKEEIKTLCGWVKKGKAWAMYGLGTRYRDGVGVKQSDTKTIELYEMAAQRGNAGAQYNLGLFYEQGMHGLIQSSKKAVEYYTLAAEQGHAGAQNNLGCIYANGQGVETSYSKAREWWTKAAAQGSKEAIDGLKQLDEHGL